MRKFVFSIIATLLVSTAAHATTYKLKVVHIDCDKCVQRIQDYFDKNLGARVQNLKIDKENDLVTFDSISVDSIEMESIKKGLSVLGFKASTVEQKVAEETKEPKKPAEEIKKP